MHPYGYAVCSGTNVVRTDHASYDQFIPTQQCCISMKRPHFVSRTHTCTHSLHAATDTDLWKRENGFSDGGAFADFSSNLFERKALTSLAFCHRKETHSKFSNPGGALSFGVKNRKLFRTVTVCNVQSTSGHISKMHSYFIHGAGVGYRPFRCDMMTASTEHTSLPSISPPNSKSPKPIERVTAREMSDGKSARSTSTLYHSCEVLRIVNVAPSRYLCSNQLKFESKLNSFCRCCCCRLLSFSTTSCSSSSSLSFFVLLLGLYRFL